MKKTAKTILTAAMFALAANPATAGAEYDPYYEDMPSVYGPPEYFTTTEPVAQTTTETVTKTRTEPTMMTTTMTDFVAVYGPPEYFTRTTTATTEDPIIEITTYMADVYGPPPVGDLNIDGRTDVFDVIELRKLITGGESSGYLYQADVNGDGKVSIADLVMMNQFILGVRENFDDDVPVTQQTTKLPDPDYGPPWAMN